MVAIYDTDVHHSDGVAYYSESAAAKVLEDARHNYVLGFVFDLKMENVVLIRKKKPAWQEGLLNGVGGKIEPGESPLQAMIREYEEEANLRLWPSTWNYLATVAGDDWFMSCYYAVGNIIYEFAETPDGAEEEIEKWPVWAVLGAVDIIPNLRYLIPLAQYKWQQKLQQKAQETLIA